MSELEQSGGKPNLTPILDMVFQLITFFMLVINFKANALDLTLKLPIVGSAQPVNTGETSLLILNVDAEGNLIVSGVRQPDPATYIAGEGQVERLRAKREGKVIERGEELPVMVVIRADRATPYGYVHRVIKACQDDGFVKFALKTRPVAKGD